MEDQESPDGTGTDDIANPYPIPAVTTAKRSPKVQASIRAYIHPITEQQEGDSRVFRRSLDVPDLARRFGVGVSHLRRCIVEDHVDDFSNAIESEKIKSSIESATEGEVAALRARSADTLIKITSEQSRQWELIDTLKGEAKRVESRLKSAEPGTPRYSRLVKDLAALRAELEHYTGKAAQDREQAKQREIAAAGLVRARIKGIGIEPQRDQGQAGEPLHDSKRDSTDYIDAVILDLDDVLGG